MNPAASASGIHCRLKDSGDRVRCLMTETRMEIGSHPQNFLSNTPTVPIKCYATGVIV